MLCKFKKGVVKLLRKHFVLSAGTVVAKRNVTQSFGNDNTVIIPMATLDKLQSKYLIRRDERARIAKEFMDFLGTYSFKELREGIIQPNGSCLKVVTDYKREINKKVGELKATEARMLQTCLRLQESLPEGEQLILVSKSPLLRMKAELTGVKAQTFKDELLPELREQYTGRVEVHVTDDIVTDFYANKKIGVEEVFDEGEKKSLYPNVFVHLKGTNSNAIGRVQGEEIVKLTFEKCHPYGVTPKNLGQRFAIEALMMDEKVAPLTIIKGPAGTAKTFLSLATGLELTEERGKFPNGILVSRSPTETGEKLGFLPGTEEEKIAPYMRGIKDNLRGLFKRDKEEPIDDKPLYEDGTSFFERDLIQAEALGYIRGRTIINTFMIVDEAQNLTPVEVKTILTRVGMGTKLVLIGDPEQIDRPGLDERTNGLSYASERMKGQDICWQITFKDDESVRSELAKTAAMLL